MAADNLGKCTCPECGGLAVVNRKPPSDDGKPKLAFRWCRECHAQYFPRSAAAEARLVASILPPGQAPAPAAPPPTRPPAPTPAPAPRPAAGDSRLFSSIFRATQ